MSHVAHSVVDLHEQASRQPRLLTTEHLDDEVRERARATWRGRMVSEHTSAHVFGTLLGQGVRAGLSSDRLDPIAKAIDQELSHGLLCARVVVALGGEARGEMDGPMPMVPTHDDVAPLEGLVRNLISISCVFETLAVSLVSCEREQVRVDELKDVFSRILGDEVEHARLGWALLDSLPRFDAAQQSRLGAYLVDVFDHVLDHFGPLPHAPTASDEALRWGASDGPGNWDLVLDTMHTAILPCLEKHDLPARAAWRAAATGARLHA